MKKAFYGFLCYMTLVGQSFAIGLAIKLDITKEDQEIIKQISQAGPLATPSESKLVVTVPHVTIGYIENLPTLLSAQEAEKIATTFIAEYLQTDPLFFTVEGCQIKFSGRVTSLVPTSSSAAIFKEANSRLEQYMNSKGYSFNKLTTNQSYDPHLTLKRNATDAIPLEAMTKKITQLKQENPNGILSFTITGVSCSTSR